MYRVYLIALAAVCLMGLSMCSDPVSPKPDPIPNPIAEDITVYVIYGYTPDTLDTFELATEGNLEITTSQPGAGEMFAMATADGFYTEAYTCTTGSTIAVNLDSVPQDSGSLAGIVFQIEPITGHLCVTAGHSLEVKEPGGPTITSVTDANGRYHVSELASGTVTIYPDPGLYLTPDSHQVTNGALPDYQDLYFWGGLVVYAPNLYLYPETTTLVSVEVEPGNGGSIIASEPPYNDGWQVSVDPEGMIDGQYGYLFYEARVAMPINLKTGWVVDGSDLEAELRRLLMTLGFEGREIDDFVEYWIPRLGSDNWYTFYPQDTELMSSLSIQPQPVSVLRHLFYIRPSDTRPTITEPPTPDLYPRDGFIAVEWGVIGWGQ